jgi:hypothetical protein
LPRCHCSFQFFDRHRIVNDVGISEAEIIVVARAQVELPSGLKRDRPVAVKFQLVFPPVAVIREAVSAEQQHRIDKTAFRFRRHDGESSSSMGARIAWWTPGELEWQKGGSEEDGWREKAARRELIDTWE